MQVVLSAEGSALTVVYSDQFLQGSYKLVNNSGSIARHEPYKNDDISCIYTFSVKRFSQVKWNCTWK